MVLVCEWRSLSEPAVRRVMASRNRYEDLWDRAIRAAAANGWVDSDAVLVRQTVLGALVSVGLLLVGLSGLEAVQAHAQGRHPQELPPALAGPLAFRHQVVQVEGLHHPSTRFAYAGAPCSGVAGVQANL